MLLTFYTRNALIFNRTAIPRKCSKENKMRVVIKKGVSFSKAFFYAFVGFMAFIYGVYGVYVVVVIASDVLTRGGAVMVFALMAGIFATLVAAAIGGIDVTKDDCATGATNNAVNER